MPQLFVDSDEDLYHQHDDNEEFHAELDLGACRKDLIQEALENADFNDSPRQHLYGMRPARENSGGFRINQVYDIIPNLADSGAQSSAMNADLSAQLFKE